MRGVTVRALHVHELRRAAGVPRPQPAWGAEADHSCPFRLAPSIVAGMSSPAALFLALTLCAVGCAEPEPACSAPIDEACIPLFDPTFNELHRRVLLPTCSTGGGACHAISGARGGLILEDLDGAYEALVGASRVIPGEPSCGPILSRLNTQDGDRLMPPGRRLDDGTLCAFQRWVEDGAPR